VSKPLEARTRPRANEPHGVNSGVAKLQNTVTGDVCAVHTIGSTLLTRPKDRPVKAKASVLQDSNNRNIGMPCFKPALHQRTSVLVADDDQIFRSVVAAHVARLSGRCEEAKDGLQAWEKLFGQKFDLAIVDLNMPELDGMSLIRRMRSHPRTMHMPIIVITANDDINAIRQALEAGATSFLTKPLKWTTFEQHLAYLLRLAEKDRSYRTSLQLATVLDRSKEGVLNRLCQEILAETASIRSHIEAARRQPHSATTDLYLEEAHNGLESLQVLAAKSSRFCQLLRLGIAVKDNEVPLSELLDDVVNEVSDAARLYQVTVKTNPIHESILVRCDRPSIHLALTEVVQNAITYSPQGTQVSITTRVYPDGLLVIDVSDEGCGMHPDYIATLLSQGVTNILPFDGCAEIGFGLLLTKAIVDAHGGALEVRSMTSKGTTVLLILPSDRVETRQFAA